MTITDIVYSKSITAVHPAFALLLEPPTWTRLEPVSITGDPRPGLEARIADPLWMIGRQWQFGEFAGDDAGTPVSVRIDTTSQPVRGFRAVGGVTQPLDPGALLEPLVTREPPTGPPGLRVRAESGAAFLAALTDAGLDGLRPAVLAAVGVAAEPIPATDPSLASLLAVLVGRMVDGEQLAVALEAGRPAWLTDPSAQAAIDATCAQWLAEYRAEVSPTAAAPDCWVSGRLEYSFEIAVATGDGEVDLVAPEFDGADVDWHSFAASADRLGVDAAAPTTKTQRILASGLSFPGLPSERLFEFEDAEVNIGALEVEPHDLARLLFAEFALTYGGDWLAIPFDVPVAALNDITSVIVTNTFNEHLVVAPVASPNWQMFVTTGIAGLLTPPAAVQIVEGALSEDVLFLRDEMANLVWAVERTVTGPSGDSHDRSTEARPGPTHVAPTVARAELDWVLQTSTPPNWFPYLPSSDGYRTVGLTRGRVEGQAPPVGRLLGEDAQRQLFDGEVPRDGVRVRRLPVLARRADGTYERWTTRRVTTGRGEGWSGLAFDTAAPRK